MRLYSHTIKGVKHYSYAWSADQAYCFIVWRLANPDKAREMRNKRRKLSRRQDFIQQ